MKADSKVDLREDKFPGNEAAFDDLKSYVGLGQITAFTGAGVGVPLFPSWRALLNDLLAEAQKSGLLTDSVEIGEYTKLIDSDPLELASALEDLLTKEHFRARLAKTFRNPAGTATECQRAISNLQLRGIVTLNYDNGHEVAHALKGRNPNTGRSQDRATLTRWLQGAVFSDADSPILHFHGDTSDPNEMIFTGDDYNRFYSSPLPETLITQLWRSNRMLVIGFGFSDPFLTRVAEKTLRSLPSENRHFAIIGKRHDEPTLPIHRQMFIKKYRLNPVFYEIRKTPADAGAAFDNHSDLLEILNALPRPDISKIIHVATDGVSPMVVLEGPAPASTTDRSERRDYKQDLFVSPSGTPLYAEPRLLVSHYPAFPTEEAIGIGNLVRDESSYIITARSEYGATTLARRLVSDISDSGKIAILRDASLLPNYKKKLKDLFDDLAISSSQQPTLVLDNFDFNRDERLLKEIIGLSLFKRLVIFARTNNFGTGDTIPLDALPIPFKPLTLGNLDRAGIRALTNQLFETSDSNIISQIVDHVYRDLIDLCIPTTPSNIIMYLSVLHKEGDFQPINRVQIVDRYLSDILRRPSDAYKDTFNAKNKLDVISSFVFWLFSSTKADFTEADWYLFCRDYMRSTLVRFDERALLSDATLGRIFIRLGGKLFFQVQVFLCLFFGAIHCQPTRSISEGHKRTYISAISGACRGHI